MGAALHPSRGERSDAVADTSRALTIDEYRKNAHRPMLSVEAADRFRWEAMQMPNYRRDMQLDEDYYDGHQLSSEVLLDLEERGIPPVVTNLIGPTIDVVLGMQLKMRRDFVVRAESDPKWDDTATALSHQLKVAERLARADHACNEAHKRQIKGGLGIVEVRRESDPYKYRYCCEHRDWKEFDWDPHSEDYFLDDARFLRRSKFYDRAHLESIFWDQRKQIHELGPGWRDQGVYAETRTLYEAPMLRGASHGPWRDYSLTELQYIDWDRDRLMLEEIWYRVWVRGDVVDLPDGTAVPYDRSNEIHNYALETGRAVLRSASWAEMRLAYYAGPLRLADVPSPHPFRGFPYVFFWGMREGRTGVPYGLIRRMRPMQDEVNARNSKMLWALSARRVIADPTAVLDHEATRLEVARPDAYVLLNPKRKPEDRFEVDSNFDIGDQQFKVLQDRIQRLQDTGGVYQAMLGKKETGADSGIAIANLVEQGATTLAPLNENFAMSRSAVGDRLLAYVVADLKGRSDVPIQVSSPARGKRVIVLNQRVHDERIQREVVENNVAKARVKVVLDDAPSTPTFRQQQFMRIGDMVSQIAKINPQLATQFMDLFVAASDVPNREEFLERIREAAGIRPDPSTMTPEQRQQFEAQQQEAQQIKEIELRGLLAKIGLDEAKVAELTTKTAATQTKLQPETELILAKVAELLERIESMRQDRAHQEAVVASSGGQIKTEALLRW